MAKVVADISMSLDGFVAGPHDGLGRGLGEGGEPIHNWIMGGPWTYSGGPPFQASGVGREVLAESFADVAAVIVGRRMYDVVDGWGNESPFDLPVFVVTSRPHPARTVGKTSYTFVSGGSTPRSRWPGTQPATVPSGSAGAPASSSNSWPTGWSTRCRCTSRRCWSGRGRGSSGTSARGCPGWSRPGSGSRRTRPISATGWSRPADCQQAVVAWPGG